MSLTVFFYLRLAFSSRFQGPVASVFWLDDALESALRLDGIVTLIDAKNFRRQLQRGSFSEENKRESESAEPGAEQPEKRHQNEAAMQVAYADRILVNKVRSRFTYTRAVENV